MMNSLQKVLSKYCKYLLQMCVRMRISKHVDPTRLKTFFLYLFVFLVFSAKAYSMLFIRFATTQIIF